MVKSGLEFFILKFTKPLQSCCCPVPKNLPIRAELAWQVSRYLWRGSVNFKINSRPLFTIILNQKCKFQNSRFWRNADSSDCMFSRSMVLLKTCDRFLMKVNNLKSSIFTKRTWFVPPQNTVDFWISQGPFLVLLTI